MSGVEKALNARAKYVASGKQGTGSPDFQAKLLVNVYKDSIWIAISGGEPVGGQTDIKFRRTIKRPADKPVSEIVTRMIDELVDQLPALFEDNPVTGDEYDW